MSIVAPVRNVTVRRRCAIRPIAKVIIAGPSSIAMVSAPTSRGVDAKPSQIDRY